MKILITGSAGFIGFNLAAHLLKKKCYIIGIDNYDDYYDVSIKKKEHLYLKNLKSLNF